VDPRPAQSLCSSTIAMMTWQAAYKAQRQLFDLKVRQLALSAGAGDASGGDGTVAASCVAPFQPQCQHIWGLDQVVMDSGGVEGAGLEDAMQLAGEEEGVDGDGREGENEGGARRASGQKAGRSFKRSEPLSAVCMHSSRSRSHPSSAAVQPGSELAAHHHVMVVSAWQPATAPLCACSSIRLLLLCRRCR
jgi:hypothetical protein